MGDFSYITGNPGYTVSFYWQMDKFLKQLCTEAGLDSFDIREEKSEYNGGQNCARDVLLVRDGVGLLSVRLTVRPASDAAGFHWPEEKIVKQESGFGGRLAEAIEKQAPPKATAGPLPRIHPLHWWIVFRGPDMRETTYEGNQFDLTLINEAFNAIESRLIKDITERAALKSTHKEP